MRRLAALVALRTATALQTPTKKPPLPLRIDGEWYDARDYAETAPPGLDGGGPVQRLVP